MKVLNKNTWEKYPKLNEPCNNLYLHYIKHITRSLVILGVFHFCPFELDFFLQYSKFN